MLANSNSVNFAADVSVQTGMIFKPQDNPEYFRLPDALHTLR